MKFWFHPRDIMMTENQSLIQGKTIEKVKKRQPSNSRHKHCKEEQLSMLDFLIRYGHGGGNWRGLIMQLREEVQKKGVVRVR